jgi:hypothetical protein
MIVDKKKITEIVGGQQRTKWVPNLPKSWQAGRDFMGTRYLLESDDYEINFSEEQLAKVEVLAFKVKIILEEKGVFSAIDNMINSGTDFALKMKWNTANTFNRYDPLIMSFGQQLNLDLDKIWAEARDLP